MNADVATSLTPARTRLVLAAMLSGLLLAMLDQTVVGTALPRIVRDLGGGHLYAWAVTAYVVPATVTLPLYARLSDRYGRRALLLVGMAVFLVGSALGATAGSMGQLVAWRALQGGGAGALEGLSFILVTDLFQGRRSTAWQGALAGLMAFSFLGGPLIGGLLTDHLGWHAVFLVNLPIGVAAMGVVAFALPAALGRCEDRTSVPDYLGMALLTGAIASVLLGLSRVGIPVLAAIPVALALLAAFVVVEARAAAPVLPLRLMCDRTLAPLLATASVAAAAMFAAVLLLPRYFQDARHVSATHSGLLIYPLLLGVLASVNAGAQLIAKTLRVRAVLLGAAVLVLLGALGFATFGAHTPGWRSFLSMALIGCGVGPTFSGLQIAVQRNTPPRDIAAAMGTLILLRQLGGTVALAAAQEIYLRRLHGAHSRVAAATATGAGVAIIATVGTLLAVAALLALPPASRRLPEPARAGPVRASG